MDTCFEVCGNSHNRLLNIYITPKYKSSSLVVGIKYNILTNKYMYFKYYYTRDNNSSTKPSLMIIVHVC